MQVRVNLDLLVALYEQQMAKGDTAWTRAIHKAYSWLVEAEAVELLGDALVVPSRSSDATYACGPRACTCPAPGLCWHRAARWLVTKAQSLELAGVTEVPLPVARVAPAAPAPKPLPAPVALPAGFELVKVPGPRYVVELRRGGELVERREGAAQSWRRFERELVAVAVAL